MSGRPSGQSLRRGRGPVPIEPSEVLRDRQVIWRDAQLKLRAEAEMMDVPDKDWLYRMKLVDDRLGVLFGDRAQVIEPAKKAKPAGRLSKYRLVS